MISPSLPLPLGEVAERSEDGEGTLNVTAKTLSVACGDSSPSGRAKEGLCEYVQFSKFRKRLLLTAPIQRYSRTNLMLSITGGAYLSARIVTKCE